MSFNNSPQSDPPEADDGGEPIDPAKAARFRQVVDSLKRSSASGNAEQFEAAAMELMGLAVEHAGQNPTPENELEKKLDASMRNSEWEEVLRLRRELIERERRKKDDSLLWMQLCRLSKLLLMLGRTHEAMERAENALAAGHEADLDAAVAYTAQHAAYCALALDNPQRAMEFIQQAFTAMESPGTREAGFGHLSAAHNLIVRARCHVARGDLTAAEADLAVAWPTFQRFADSEMMAGVQARIGDSWEITGLIQRARGEISGAIESLEKAVELRMRLALIDDDERPICLCRLARTLREHERMLMDGGRNGDAAEVRDQVREICEIIHLPLSLFDR